MTLTEVLQHFEGVTSKGNGQYMAKCPAHPDKKASLSIKQGDKGGIVLHCFAGCDNADILAAAGLTQDDIRAPKADKPAGKRIVAIYSYTDDAGKMTHQKIRYSDKSFTWRQPKGDGWQFNRSGRAPTLYASEKPLPDAVFLVEGEKDVDTLKACGVPACSVPNGAKSKWEAQFTDMLRGKEVYIIPDNDTPGMELAKRAANELKGAAKCVKLLDLKRIWPEIPEKGDVSDLIEHMSRDITALLGLVRDTPDYIERIENGFSVTSARELQDKQLDPVQFVVCDLLPHGLSLLASPPKYGKSWFVLDLGLSVAEGRVFLNHNTNKCGCLYLALEDSEHRLQDRMNKVLGGRRAPEHFDYATSAMEIGNGLIDQLEDYVKSHPETGLIIIDTLQKVRGAVSGNINAYSADYRDTGMLKAFADKHGLCVLLVHHLRKMGDDGDPFSRIAGTNGIFGAADTAMVMTRNKRNDDTTLLSVTGRDVENSETVLRFDNYKWHVVGDAAQIAEEQARQEYEQSPIVQTVRKLVQHGEWSGTMKELMEAGKLIAHTYLAESTRALSAKITALERPLYEYDHITHSRISKHGNAGYKHRFQSADNFQRVGVEDSIFD